MTIAELTGQRLSEAEAQAVLTTKREAEAVKRVIGDQHNQKRSLKSRSRRKREASIPSYQGLEGQWLSYYKVARLYESKIPAQDRDDFRHDVMIELERATKRDGKPLPDLRAYRIASLMVALYFRNLNRYATRVCIFSGCPVEPHCRACKNKTEGKRCAWLAVRPVDRLDGQIIDSEGYRVRLLDTVADDKAIDLVAKLDAHDWLLGCKLPLIQIANKLNAGIELNRKEANYLYHFRNRDLKKFQKALF